MDTGFSISSITGNVLLVELVNADQFPGRIAYLYPHFAGYFDATGRPTRWVRFGISTTNLMDHEQDEVTLASAELDLLLERAASHDPALVILTDPISPPQLAMLRARVPRARIHRFDPSDPNDPLAIDRHSMESHPGMRPRYDWEAGNAAAAEKKHDNIYLTLRLACGHWRPVGKNPLFEGIDDPRVARHIGCSFCARNPSAPGPLAGAEEAEPSEWLLRQLSAIVESRGGPERFPNAILLERTVSAGLLSKCLGWMEELGLAGRVQLLLAMRPDHAGALARAMTEHFERAPSSKARLGVYSSGIESFSEIELTRLNKGTTPLDGLRAVNTLRELADRYPESFTFTGISFLLFTPWTTPETLHLEVGLVRFLGLTRKEAGNLFQSRLRMHPQLPITALAERDGIVTDFEPDQALIMNRRKLFAQERAWRFADPRTRPLCRIVLRYDLIGKELRDALTDALAKRLREVTPEWTPGHDQDFLDYLLAMIDVARGEPAPLDEETLLDRGRDLWLQRRALPERVPGSRRFRIGEERLALADLLARLAPLVASGQKSLLSIEGVLAAELEESVPARLGLRALFVEPREGVEGTLLVARTDEALGEARAVLDAVRSSEGEARRAAIEAAGTMHGVPACCAKAHAQSPFGGLDLHAFAALARRADAEAKIASIVSPRWIPALGFVPCAFDCAEAGATYRGWLEAAGCVPSDADAHVLDVLAPGDGELVALRVLGHDERSLSYDPRLVADGDGELRARLREGDRLALLPGQVQIRKGEELVELLTASHAVWSPERCWHGAEWTELARAAARKSSRGRRRTSERAGTLASRMRRLLEIAAVNLRGRIGDLRVLDVAYDRDERTFTVRIGAGAESATLILQDPKRTARSMFRTAHFAIVQPRSDEAPLGRAAQEQARLWLLALERLARRHAPALLPGAQGEEPPEERERPDAEKRLLLLELVTDERWVFDSRLFPFIAGCAESLGFEARWLCFGTSIQVKKTGSTEVRQSVELTESELSTLERHVRELRPTHVVMSHSVSAAAMELFTRECPSVSVLSTSDHRPPAGAISLHPFVGERVEHGSREASDEELRTRAKLGGSIASWRVGRTDWLLRWLGDADAGRHLQSRYIADAIRPTYDAIMANEQAREHRPHVLVLGGIVCDHLGKLDSNEHYEGLDLSGCEHDSGCAYCTWYRGPNSDMRSDAVELAGRQLRRVLETAREDGRYCGVFDVLDIRLFSQIERFTEMVLGLDLPPSTFCFEPRIDRFVRVAKKLEAVLPRLRAAGHCIYLFRMGAENLIEEENFLFNKHVTLPELDEGRRALTELAARFPGSFEFDPTWGYISCSPWTTLDMLGEGIERAIARGFEPLGVWLYTPLLLFRGSPITRKAERDGDIVVDRYEDVSLLYEPSVNNVSVDVLTPWKFRDERTGRAFALIVRFCAAALRGKYPDAVFGGDELYAHLVSREKECGPYDRPDLFAREVVAAVRASSAGGLSTRLLDDALERYRTLPPRQAARGPRPTPSSAPDARARRMERLVDAVQKHVQRSFPGLAMALLPASSGSLAALRVELEGASYVLSLAQRSPERACFFRTAHFAVSHAKDTPVRSPAHKQSLSRIISVLDAAATRHAPDLLTGGRPGPEGSAG